MLKKMKCLIFVVDFSLPRQLLPQWKLRHCRTHSFENKIGTMCACQVTIQENKLCHYIGLCITKSFDVLKQ